MRVIYATVRAKIQITLKIPVGPGPSLTDVAPPRRLPLAEGGGRLAVLLLQHAVVAQVLLATAPRERLHKLLLRGRGERGHTVITFPTPIYGPVPHKSLWQSTGRIPLECVSSD